MDESARAKQILEMVMRIMAPAPWFKPFKNRVEKAGFCVGGVAYVLTTLSSILALTTAWPWWGVAAFFLFFIAQVSTLIALTASFITSIPQLLQPERGWVDPIIDSFEKDLDLIAQLQMFEQHQLEYALDRMTLIVKQFRTRIALVMGALDKIGLIPLAVTTFFTLREAFAKSPLDPFHRSLLWAIAGALVLIYLLGVYGLGRAEQLDDACLVLKHAVEARKSAGIAKP